MVLGKDSVLVECYNFWLFVGEIIKIFVFIDDFFVFFSEDIEIVLFFGYLGGGILFVGNLIGVMFCDGSFCGLFLVVILIFEEIFVIFVVVICLVFILIIFGVLEFVDDVMSFGFVVEFVCWWVCFCLVC